MRLNDALLYSFGQIRDGVHGAIRGLDRAALAWRPDPEANSIAWLVWHLTRVADDHVAEIAGGQQRWAAGEWAGRFGLPADYDHIGYGHSAAEVGRIQPEDAAVLAEYHDDTMDMVTGYIGGAADEEFDRIIDSSYDPPVTVGVRLMSVNGDALQHLGQAAYLRGLLQRRD